MWGRRVVFESVCCSSSAIDCVGSQCCSHGPIVERVTAATGTVNVFSLLAANIFLNQNKRTGGGECFFVVIRLQALQGLLNVTTTDPLIDEATIKYLISHIGVCTHNQFHFAYNRCKIYKSLGVASSDFQTSLVCRCGISRSTPSESVSSGLPDSPLGLYKTPLARTSLLPSSVSPTS